MTASVYAIDRRHKSFRKELSWIGSSKDKVILLCEGWPSWLCTASSIHAVCHQVFITTHNAKWFPKLQPFFPDVLFLPYFTFNGSVSLSSIYVILDQGSTSWWNQFQNLFTEFPRVICSLHAGQLVPHHSMMALNLLPHATLIVVAQS
jgi:hypothetical protein